MKLSLKWSLSIFAGILFASQAVADDRLTFSANGETLTDTSGGGGASVGWLHNFSPDALLGVGVEYQAIANAHWTVGSISGAYIGGDARRRWNLSGNFRKGSGWNGARSFDYQDASVGASIPLIQKLSMQLEDRQIDIDTAHGNLPKIGVSFLVNPRLLTSVSYARSIGGNLGTEITTGRVDYYIGRFHLIGGGAFGSADPIVLNLATRIHLPSRTLKEGFAGFGRTSTNFEWQLLGDYQKLASSERVTVTLSYTRFLNGPARSVPGR